MEDANGKRSDAICYEIRSLMTWLFSQAEKGGAFVEWVQKVVVKHLHNCADCAAVFTLYERIEVELQSLLQDPTAAMVRVLFQAQQLDHLPGAPSVEGPEGDQQRGMHPSITMKPELAAMFDAMRRGEDVGSGSDEQPDERSGNGSQMDSGRVEACPAEWLEEAEGAGWEGAAHQARAVRMTLNDLVVRALSMASGSVEYSLGLSREERLMVQQGALVDALQCLLTTSEVEAIAHRMSDGEHGVSEAWSTLEPAFRLATAEMRTDAQWAAQAGGFSGYFADWSARTEEGTRTFLQQSSDGRTVIESLRPGAATREFGGETTEVIYGAVPALEAAIYLLTRAASTLAGAYPIIITLQHDGVAVFPAARTLNADWDMTLRRLVERGWDIKHLVQRSESKRSQTHKARVVAENLHSLLGASGRYDPYFVSPGAWPAEQMAQMTPNGDAIGFGGDVEEAGHIIVPGMGAVTLFTRGGREVTHALYTAPGRTLDALVRPFSAIWRGANRAYSACYRWPDKKYHEAIVRLEQQPGNRFVLVDGLSDSAVPYIIHRQRAQSLLSEHPERSDEILHVLGLQRTRTAAVLGNLHTYQFCDMTSRSAIRRLVHEGKYQAQGDIWSALGAADLTRGQVRVLLKALIRRLAMYPNYQLLLLDGRDAEVCRTEFMVKPEHAAFVEYWLADSSGHRVRSDVEIVEPTVVQAYSEALWKEMALRAESRKDRVIAFLREQLATLDDHC